MISISDPVSVKSVRFPTDSMALFLKGSAESLWVVVEPPEASPAVVFQISDSSVVSITNGHVLGAALGKVKVIARSVAYPGISDTLYVEVFQGQRVDSVRVNPRSLKLFTGGAGATLSGQAYPSTIGSLIQWRSSNQSVVRVDASGKVDPVGVGGAVVLAISRLDSLARDSAQVLVKRDVPHVDVGHDTTVSLGSSVTIFPVVTQEYGTVAQFKWDLNGDGVWDDSSANVKAVTYTIDQERDFASAFYIRDSEGNDTVVVKHVKAVKGPALVILSPANNSFTNQPIINVSWSINGIVQDSLTKETLVYGKNTIVRSTKDEAGSSFSASVTVTWDTLPPNRPLVHGVTPTNSITPIWSWSGGGGGAGVFRLHMDTEEFSGAPELKDTSYTPPTALSPGVHTLFVQERDLAGNWSPSGRFSITIDLTPPGQPGMSSSASTWSNSAKPTWVWISGGEEGMGTYRCKIDDNNMESGTTLTTQPNFTSSISLAEGPHVLYVQERDSAGNWSTTSPFSIRVDLTPPGDPVISATPLSPLNSLQPNWTWVSGGGGMGKYRYRLDGIDLNSDAIISSIPSFKPGNNLAQGQHILYVQESDSAGNWSATSSRAIVVSLRENVGPPGFTSGSAFHISLAIGKSGEMFSEYSNGGSPQTNVVVMKFNGSSWIQLPDPGLILANDWHSSMALDSSENVYIAGSDSSKNGKLTVKRYNGTSWELVGTQGFTAGKIYFPTIAVSKSNMLYVAYSDDLGPKVARFNGSVWENLGSLAGFNFFLGINNGPSLALTSTGEPYIACFDTTNRNLASVLRYNGSSWELVGDYQFVRTNFFNLAISPADEPYFAFLEPNIDNKISVMKFTKGHWEYQGSSGFSRLGANTISLAFDASGAPYVAFDGQGNGLRATIMSFNGTSWQNVGPDGFSDDLLNLTLAVGSTGIPYLAYTDDSQGDKLTVVKTSYDP